MRAAHPAIVDCKDTGRLRPGKQFGQGQKSARYVRKTLTWPGKKLPLAEPKQAPTSCALGLRRVRNRGSCRAIYGSRARSVRSPSSCLRYLPSLTQDERVAAKAWRALPQSRAVPRNLRPHLRRCGAAQRISGIQRAAQAQNVIHVFFNFRMELLQYRQGQF